MKHYPPTPYDDLLAQLVDREQAARLGAAVRADAGPDLTRQSCAAMLRQPGMAWRRARSATPRQDRLVEVGWLGGAGKRGAVVGAGGESV